MFIDASNEFIKGKNQNKLTDENINKFIETYKNRVDVDKYAHMLLIRPAQHKCLKAKLITDNPVTVSNKHFFTVLIFVKGFHCNFSEAFLFVSFRDS